MDTTTLFVVGLFLLVGCAVAVGELVSRLGQTALIGQLAVGVVLGPTLLGGPLGLTAISPEFSGLEILATFFVLMTAGLAVTPDQIYATGGPSAALGITIFVVPFLAGSGVVHLLYPALGWTEGLFVSLTISITALPVLGVMLREFGLFGTRFGTFLLNGAVVNELAAVTTFSILLRAHATGYALGASAAIAGLTVVVFLTSILAVHFGLRSLRELHLWDRLVARFRRDWHSPEGGFAFLMVGGLAAALYSQLLGLTFLVGAFYAGLLVTPASAGVREHRDITRIFEAVTWGFFIPLFFALVGFGMDLRTLLASPLVLAGFAALCLFAFVSKLSVGGLVARALGWPPEDALAAGFLLASRGAVELAMAVLLLSLGIFDTAVYTVVAGVGLVTTFLSPFGARPFVRPGIGPGGPPVAGSARPGPGSLPSGPPEAGGSPPA